VAILEEPRLQECAMALNPTMEDGGNLSIPMGVPCKVAADAVRS